MSFQRCLATLITLTLLASTSANAQFSVHVDTTVGLDQPTKTLIENFLPQNVHDQLLDLLAKALPLLKTDIDGYLKQINDDVEKQIINGQCAGVGLSAEARRQFTKIYSNPGGPILEFRQEENRALNRITRFTSSQNYADVYGDLLYEAGVTHCQMNISQAAENAILIEKHYRPLDFMWLSLVGHCSSASSCTRTVRNDTEDLIRSSDGRDVEFVKAKEKLAAVLQPGFRNYVSFDPKVYEGTLQQLLYIQREVSLAKTRREAMAAELIDDAQKQLSNIDDEIAKGQAALTPHNVDLCFSGVSDIDIQRALPHGKAADSIYPQIEPELLEALRLDTYHPAKIVLNIRRERDLRRGQIDAILNASHFRNFIPGCTIHLS